MTSVRVRVEDFSGPSVTLLEQSGASVRLEELSTASVVVVEGSEGAQ